MANFLAWSYSRLKCFKDCPKQLWHTQAAPRGHADRVDYVETQPMRDGKEIDTALTARISDKTPLPPKFTQWEEMCQVVLSAPGNKFTQMQLALNASLQPCGYKDWDNAWVRVVYDVAILDGSYAFVGDWKNGRITVDEDQLRLFATVGFHQFPEVDTIDTSYIWLKHGVTSDKTYHRRELPDLWQTFIPDVERMQIAFRTSRWPAEPKRGKATCGWCPVNKAGKCPVALGPYTGK